MNRIIKFRAWDTKKKDWLKEIPPYEYMLDCDEWNHPDDMDSFTYPENPLNTFNGRIVYQQFVGLTDAKGKEIFEGDILRTKWGTKGKFTEGEVCFENGSFYIKTYDFLRDEAKDGAYPNGEIIGNIFENPELLGK